MEEVVPDEVAFLKKKCGLTNWLKVEFLVSRHFKNMASSAGHHISSFVTWTSRNHDFFFQTL